MILSERFDSRVRSTPDKRLFSFLANGEDLEAQVTYRQLAERAQAVAEQFAACTDVGDRVLLLYEPGLDYVVAFFACLYSGRIAVPVYPPNPRRLQQTLPRLMHIVEDAKPRAVGTTSLIRGLAEGLLTSMGLDQLAWCATDEAPEVGSFAPPSSIEASSIAFLQYTSGSTARPRGVRVSHGNLLSNVELIQRALRADENTIGVSWLPLYHDMGLIGKVITPAIVGCETVLMSPLDYLRRPFRWLSAISRFGGTTSAAPNFAYDLCTAKITDEELAQLDLSTWQVALNGAEPVRAETLRAFANRFGPVGFRHDAFLPAYGLAESTLIVTGASGGPRSFDVATSSLERGEIEILDADSTVEAKSLTSSGSVPGPGHRVRIVDPDKRVALGDGQVGEIWVSGPSVADGYWERPDLSAVMFHARLGGDDSNTYLRTGDLGFLLGDELVVTGRRKDLMILRGRNIYPQDVEATIAEAHEAVRPGGMAAFSVDEPGGEVAVIVAEVERRIHSGRAGDDRRVIETLPDHEVPEVPDVLDVAEAIRKAVVSEHRIEIAHLVLIKPGSVPKTSSGKIQRHECRRQFLEGELDELQRVSRDETPSMLVPVEPPDISLELLSFAPRRERLQILTRYLSELVAFTVGCGVERVADGPLMGIGLDSLKALELQYVIEERLGVRLFPSLLLGGASLADVVNELVDADFRLAGPPQGLADISSEVFHEPSEGMLTETIRFEVDRSHDHQPVYDERLGFSEDINPWGPTPTIEFRLDDERDAQLSWNEKGFWLYQKAFPSSWAPNLYYAGELPEGTRLAAVQAAATAIVDRHEALRTSYLTFAGTPIRQDRDDLEVEVASLDARGWTRAELIEEFERRAREPIDLEKGPIIRFAYFASDGRPLLFMMMHHIAVDFWSLERLIFEFGEEIAGNGVPAPKVSYSNFVNWQRRLLESERGQWSEQFWKERLATTIPKLRFPRSRHIEPGQMGFGRVHRAHLDLDLVAAVDELAASLRATRYTVLLSAYQVLLYRWTGQSEFMVGAVAAARTRRFFRDVVGMFANPLPLRAKFDPKKTFSEHLAATQADLLKALDAQEYPLQTMLERFELPRDGVDNPIIQTLFASEQPREGSLETDDHAGGLQTFDLGLAGTVFDFTVMVYQGQHGGEVRLQYNDAKYDEAVIVRLAESYREILREVVASPHRAVADLPLVSEPTLKSLTTQWGRGASLEVPALGVHELFERQVARTPNAVAVDFSAGLWSYEELNSRANRLAHKLIQEGVRPGDSVGVEIERSPELIASLLGVLKAGAAYVALQPSLPQRRLEYMAADAAATVVVTDQSARNSIGTVRIETSVLTDDALSTRNPEVAVDPESLAYILYTSGTTGLPKGVMLPHRAVTNLLSVIASEYPVDASDAILQKTPYSFDISVSEIFNPLVSGARIVVTEPGKSRDPSYLRDLILMRNITVLRMTPTELSTLLDVDGVSACAGTVRRVLACGEALTPAVCGKFFDAWDSVQLVNLWGPTEACVYASQWTCRPEQLDEIPIGRPLPNYRLYSLDEALSAAPVELQAELFAAGPSLARGYHGMPAKTALQYLPDPFASSAGSRMYKSGDLVCWNEEQELEFFGRKDSQVQLRGMRIELGEIESFLEQHARVRKAAVRAISAPDGRVESLIGYVVLDAPGAVEPAQLRAHLLDHMEEAKVPGQFVELAEMPLTPSGKVDRKLLPDPDQMMRSKERTEPSTPAEKRLAALWRKHLGLEEVGVHENFFEIGGHSLLAVRIQHEIMRTFGLEVPLSMLFENPTIEALALRLSGSDAFEFAPVERQDYGDEAPLSSGQKLMWIQQYLEGNSATYQSPGVFLLKGTLDREALQRALTGLVGRHEILRTIYPVLDEEPVQKILPPPDSVDVEFEDLRGDGDEARIARGRVAAFVAQPFALTEETSFRVLLLQTAPREHVLCLLFHHIAFDEWSVDVLFEEVEALYRMERGDVETDADESRVEDWKQTYQVAYRNLARKLENGEIREPTFNTDGWLSSYSGETYSDPEMREWLRGSLERLRGLDLGRTLEIGCGTGMILFECAPHATEYVGVDFSQAALAYIDAVRDRLDRDLSHVQLVQGRADQLEEIEGEFDTIIINSVAQYFPNHAYLEEVIRTVGARLRPGGRFYLGDLRDARTAFAFHASVVMGRATEEATRGDLRERTLERLASDDELLISPQYLVQLAKSLPQISHIDFNYQRARHATEMSLFRFCATLHVRGAEPYRAPEEVLHWDRDALDVQSVSSRVESGVESLLVLGIPNKRQEPYRRFQSWLLDGSDDTSFAEFRGLDAKPVVEPDELRAVGESRGFRVTVMPSNDALGVRFDALFERDVYDLPETRALTPLVTQTTAIPLPAVATDGADDLAVGQKLWADLISRESVRGHGRSVEVEAGPTQLPEPALQYADFAIWQRKQFEGTDYENGLDFWRSHLSGARSDVSWPVGRPEGRKRPAGYVQHSWSPVASEAVASFARAQGVSEFMVLYAAFSAFLAQYCNQPDLTVGVGTTLRQRPEFRDILGYMLNMLPLRANGSLDDSFEAWFKHVRGAWDASQQHQWIPVERIVEAVGADRGAGSLSLYDVMMAYVPRNHLRRSSVVTDDFVREMAGLQVRPFEYGGVPDALCSLFVSLFKEGATIGSEFEYDALRFDRWQVEQLAQRFEWAVEQALKVPSRSLARTMAAGAEEPSRLLGTWTRGPRFEASATPIHHQFEEWAQKTPEETALLFEGGRWTFVDLERRANQIARHLIAGGVRPGMRVGVTVERSPELVAALLGVMKAGACFVAMEPDLPAARLRFIAEDASAAWVLVDEVGKAALRDGPQMAMIDVREAIDSEIDGSPVGVEVDPDDLIYMLYTSGSTGNPKGVMMPHRAVANHVAWLAEGYGCGSKDVFLLKSSYGFDMSVSELFGPLCLGGTMAIAKPDGHRDPAYLVDAVGRFGVTCLRVVPTTLNLLLTEPGSAAMEKTLRWVSLGGEALSRAVRDRFFDTFETVELHNPYGITETCVDVSFWECPRERRGQEVSLGHPMGNYDAYTLDEWLLPVPGERVGEIFVGGAGVSYGYWGLPRRTALAFVPNPFAEQPGARMYASGDLGRYDQGGELRYQGRKDDQIQLHGIRIELGEVEAHMLGAPGVRQAAVKTVDESEGRAEGLIGYIVPEEGVTPDIGEIRAYLEQQLRRAVIPTRFVILDSMPRRPSGKIDRDALPEPGEAMLGERAKGDTEEKLERIWCEVLGVDAVGRDANFFEAGGTSLKAIKVYRMLSQEFEVEFEVVELFAYPTIGALARFLDGGEDVQRESDLDARRNRSRRRRESAQNMAIRRGRRVTDE